MNEVQKNFVNKTNGENAEDQQDGTVALESHSVSSMSEMNSSPESINVDGQT